jgi:glycosyltransferase involved in cell wall biosynthesis
VVNNVIGNNDVIHNGDNGYVCDSVEDFVRGINEIRDGKAKKYVEKAYKDIFSLYDIKAQAKHYSKIYEGHM